MIAFHGALTGWLACLLLDRFHVIAHHSTPAAAAARTYCDTIGYPKAQDYFWYGAFVVAGALAGPGATWLAGRIRARGGHRRLPSLPLWPGWLLAIAGAPWLFHFMEGPMQWGAAATGLGLLWPWVSRRWYDASSTAPGGAAVRPAIGWRGAVLALGVAALWMRDPGIAAREVDGTHEGGHLLYVAHWAAGERPLVEIRTEYGPLMTAVQYAWTRTFGPELLSLRRCAQAAQVAGLALCLFALASVAHTRTALLAGGWLMLTASAAAYSFHPWGWPNLLRIALPLGSAVLWWRAEGEGRAGPAALAGGMAAVALLYSPEFGLVGAAMLGVLLVAGPRRPGPRVTGALIAGGAGALLGCWLLMYGADAGRAALALVDGGYLADRLGGHGARPIPVVQWKHAADGWQVHLPTLWATLSVWIPGLLASAALADVLSPLRRRLGGSRSLVAALAVGTILAHLPTIARPLGQQTLTAPMWIALAVAWRAARPGGRVTGIAGLVLALWWGWTAPYAGAPSAWARLTTRPPADAVEVAGEPMLRGLTFAPAAADRFRTLLPLIRNACPPDRRVLLVASFDVDLVPLAGRLAQRPYPVIDLAVSPVVRRALLADLRAAPPPVAVIGFFHLDIPLASAFPELSEWIETTYRERHRTPALRVMSPRSDIR